MKTLVTVLSASVVACGLLAGVAGCSPVCAGGSCHEVDPNGWSWCVEAVGANGTRTMTAADVQIQLKDDWITDCVFLCAGDNDIMELGQQGDIPPGHAFEPLWNDLKQQVRDNTANTCEGVVDDLEMLGGAINFNGMNDITCADAVELIVPYDGNMVYTDECEYAGTGGNDQVGPSHYGLTSYNQVRSCSTNTSAKTISCNVDIDFISDVTSDLSSIFSDGVELQAVTGPSGHKFISCTADSFPYALGFRLNDRLFSINGQPVATADDGAQLFGMFGQATYGGTSAVVKFYRSGVLWTMTVNRTNFSTYP